ncbi:MAG: 6-phosphofructo-2-kinase/fructose-2,6-bisphosphatase [Proteobacteria bacterium]|nr:6-phosphofructo-2-kinase/fructose-2,6-bisphosphatase [Pseudomonadota bacterium]MBU1737874.1 6-phosphofructo-2-kinase/fructose-2,6-bisphosphatase [Pseudomonadota bacterium]
MKNKLVIAMAGLPARGKSTMARKIAGTLKRDDVQVRIFNNGDVRRQLSPKNSSAPEVFSPDNPEGVKFRDHCARINLDLALEFLKGDGEVAIIDAANVTCRRRKLIQQIFPDFPVLLIECMNTDEEALEANLERKAFLKEFSHLSREQALDSFQRRIEFYESIYEPLCEERNFILVDSFEGYILQEQLTDLIPYYDRIRDLITTRIVRNLFLVRHGETYFNQEDRIGGDSDLTENGLAQANGLAEYFAGERIPIIFTSNYKRTLQTAAPIAAKQEHCSLIALPEFNEIYAGICDGMTYGEIQEQMPEVAATRKHNKYDYAYPEGESYAAMEERIHRGLQKVFYLNNYDDNIMIVGHRAVNRMILSDFVFRPREEVPYIYMPQNRYYHIQVDPHKKIFELKPYTK